MSEEAETDESVRPAPPVAPEVPEPEPEFTMPEDDGKVGITLPDEMKDKVRETVPAMF